ncbi:LuxR C-terminal-related transcriptional regulator [Dehalobacter sp. DCM]|uniref:helix-turn-helix transcriptional regulator n=1 Tax=Dehalobacter sp. DCM TaxID=2907827 RepID=UPI003081ACA0|nr:LuxR C-terminal-related transcriptional regulator [Dehalobacter sp. DCM]
MDNSRLRLFCPTDANICDMLHCQNPCIRSIDLSNDYILIFNDSMRLINLSNACSKTLKDESLPKTQLLGLDIFFFVPELKEPGAYDYYINSPHEKDIYMSEDYNVKAPVNKDSIFVKLKISRQESMTFVVGTDITSQKTFYDLYNRQERTLAELAQEYNNMKTTLDVLLKQINEKKCTLEKDYYRNLEEMIYPMLDILKTTRLDERQAATLDILEQNLKSMTQPYTQMLNIESNGLTQREIQIAQFIRLGKTTKEIADILCLSTRTIDFHRANIRKRLNISNCRDNLKSTLQTLG